MTSDTLDENSKMVKTLGSDLGNASRKKLGGGANKRWHTFPATKQHATVNACCSVARPQGVNTRTIQMCFVSICQTAQRTICQHSWLRVLRAAVQFYMLPERTERESLCGSHGAACVIWVMLVFVSTLSKHHQQQQPKSFWVKLLWLGLSSSRCRSHLLERSAYVLGGGGG